MAHLQLDGREPAVVKLVILHEGEGGLGAFHHIFLHISAAGDGGFRLQGALYALFHFHLLTDHDVGAHPHGEAHDEAQHHLARQFAFFRHAFLAVLEHLDVVVGKAQSAAPEGAHQQQLDIDVAEVAEQEHAAQDGEDDDEAAHRGGAFFLHLIRQAQVSHGFPDLLGPQPVDDLVAGKQGHQHGHHGRCHGPEAQVVHQAHAREIHSLAFQILEQVVYHGNISLKVSFTMSFSTKGTFSCPRIW